MSTKKTPAEIKKNKSARTDKHVQSKKNWRSGWMWISSILLFTFIVYYPVLKCGFTSWDDPLYVTENPLIRNFSFENILRIFSFRESVAANYHPLTILSLAIDYHFAKLNPATYHFINLLFHLFNTLLVYIFIYKLSKGKMFGALLSALIFAIHPMHVESVAWVSERKDVLYTFFFLLSMIFYLKYKESQKIRLLIFTFLLFLFSVLSKAMAVVLPVVLILIDYYEGRKLSIKNLAEKVPFFVISLIFGFLAIGIQSKESIASYETFTFTQRIGFGFFGFFMYIWKLLLPLNLSTFYPYPTLGKEIAYPASIYIPAAIGFLILMAACFILVRKYEKLKPLAFGIAFYLTTVIFVLQFISVGQVIMADRYSYVSYIGLLFPLGIYLHNFRESKPVLKNILPVFILIVALIFSYISRERIRVWENTDTLWTSVINKYPYPPWKIEIAYVGRGRYFAEKNELEKALADFNTLLSMKTKNAAVYNNLGNIYGVKGQAFQNSGDTLNAGQAFGKSLDYYSTALSLDSTGSTSTYVNRATAYIFMKEYKLAAEDFNRAIIQDPGNNSLVEKRAYAYFMSGNWTQAVTDYNYLLSVSPGRTYMFQYRGTALMNNGKYREAINDFNITIQREPQNAQAYYNLSVCYGKLNDQQNAKSFLEKAISHGYKLEPQ